MMLIFLDTLCALLVYLSTAKEKFHKRYFEESKQYLCQKFILKFKKNKKRRLKRNKFLTVNKWGFLFDCSIFIVKTPVLKLNTCACRDNKNNIHLKLTNIGLLASCRCLTFGNSSNICISLNNLKGFSTTTI